MKRRLLTRERLTTAFMGCFAAESGEQNLHIYYVPTLLHYLLCLILIWFGFWAKLGGAQALFLTLSSEIIPGGAQGAILNGGN